MPSSTLNRPVTLDAAAYSDASVRSVNFFNGRLLSGEDLSREQAANRESHKQLGRASGSGVAYGLEVALVEGSGAGTPSLTVQAGLAMNRRGRTIELPQQATVRLIQPASVGVVPGKVEFEDCTPPESGIYITGAGMYVLTIGPAEASEGRAPVSGLGNAAADCNTRHKIEAITFRLIQLDLKPEVLNDTAHLRNHVAHRCFGTAELIARADPLRSPLAAYGLLDGLRPNRLTECEVPLALLHWTNAGVQFVDMWAVRRRVVHPSAAAEWEGMLSGRRASEAQVMVLQFQDHLAALQRAAPNVGLKAADAFQFLPPAGPLPGGSVAGAPAWQVFLGALAPARAIPVQPEVLVPLLKRALVFNAFGVDSPTVVDVYESADQSGLVLFARAEHGRLRFNISPRPVGNQMLEVTVQPAGSNTRVNAGVVTNETTFQIQMVDVAPGAHTINFAPTGFEPLDDINAVAIGGRIVDVPVALTPLPKGQIRLTVRDIAGTLISNRVGSVTATTADGGATLPGELSLDGTVWVLTNLPSAAYTITTVAAGFQTSKMLNVEVKLGDVLELSATLAPLSFREQPSTCFTIARIERPALEKIKVCMVLKQAEFVRDFFEPPINVPIKILTQPFPDPVIGTLFNREVTPDIATFETAERATPDLSAFMSQPISTSFSSFSSTKFITPYIVAAIEEVPKRYRVIKDGVFLPPKISSAPWLNMTPLQSLPDEVKQWLAEWRDWFNEEFPGRGIDRSIPTIFLDPKFKPPTGFGDVPKKPQAYAVFGNLGVPLTITASTEIIKLPVLINKVVLRGLTDKNIRVLAENDIRNVDDLPGVWSGFLDELLDQTTDDSRYLVDDSRVAAKKIVDDRTYLEGMDGGVRATLDKLGLTDDVALANADFDNLSQELNSRGLASRLMSQARTIVSPKTWSLKELGLSNEQVEFLGAQGVRSKGEFISKAQGDRAVLQAALGKGGLVGAQLETLINNLDAAAHDQLTASSIRDVPKLPLSELADIQANPTFGQKLSDAGFASIDDVAFAEVADLTKAGFTEVEAESLRVSAQKAGTSALSVTQLASITPDVAAKLKANNITTVAQLAKADAATLTQVFGNKPNVGSAVVNAAKLGLRPGFKLGR